MHDEANLDDVLHTRQTLAFDLDTYRLLVKRLTPPWGPDHAIFHLDDYRTTMQREA